MLLRSVLNTIHVVLLTFTNWYICSTWQIRCTKSSNILTLAWLLTSSVTLRSAILDFPRPFSPDPSKSFEFCKSIKQFLKSGGGGKHSPHCQMCYGNTPGRRMFHVLLCAMNAPRRPVSMLVQPWLYIMPEVLTLLWLAHSDQTRPDPIRWASAARWHDTLHPAGNGLMSERFFFHIIYHIPTLKTVAQPGGGVKSLLPKFSLCFWCCAFWFKKCNRSISMTTFLRKIEHFRPK